MTNNRTPGAGCTRAELGRIEPGLPELDPAVVAQFLWDCGYIVVSRAEATQLGATEVQLYSGADLSEGQYAWLDAFIAKYSIPPQFRAE